MIPNFRTYINETYWSRMNRRAQGTLDKKEDNLDLLDFDGFFKYVEDKYKDKVFNIAQSEAHWQKYHSCIVDIKDNVSLVIYVYDDAQKNSMTLFWDNTLNTDFLKEISKKFDVNYRSGIRCLDIKPQNGQSCIKLYIQFLDFVLDNLDVMFDKSSISETYWSGMNRRSQGTLNRKEDNVDNLDFDSFYNYIVSKYEKTTYDIDHNIMHSDKYGYRTCEVYPVENVYLIIYFYDDNPDHKAMKLMWEKVGIDRDFIKNFREQFKTVYNTSIVYNTRAEYIDIIVDDKQYYNRTYIKVLDYILKNKKTMLVETYWSGMNRRSQGTLVRKENDIERFDRDGMYDLIVNTFEFRKDVPIAKIMTHQTSEENKYISIPIIWESYHLYRMSVNFNNGKINRIKIFLSYDKLKECCPSLFEKFMIVENDSGGGVQVYPKNNQKITNQFCIDVLETICMSEYGVLQKREN